MAFTRVHTSAEAQQSSKSRPKHCFLRINWELMLCTAFKATWGHWLRRGLINSNFLEHRKAGRTQTLQTCTLKDRQAHTYTQTISIDQDALCCFLANMMTEKNGWSLHTDAHTHTHTHKKHKMTNLQSPWSATGNNSWLAPIVKGYVKYQAVSSRVMNSKINRYLPLIAPVKLKGYTPDFQHYQHL